MRSINRSFRCNLWYAVRYGWWKQKIYFTTLFTFLKIICLSLEQITHNPDFNTKIASRPSHKYSPLYPRMRQLTLEVSNLFYPRTSRANTSPYDRYVSFVDTWQAVAYMDYRLMLKILSAVSMPSFMCCTSRPSCLMNGTRVVSSIWCGLSCVCALSILFLWPRRC